LRRNNAGRRKNLVFSIGERRQANQGARFVSAPSRVLHASRPARAVSGSGLPFCRIMRRPFSCRPFSFRLIRRHHFSYHTHSLAVAPPSLPAVTASPSAPTASLVFRSPPSSSAPSPQHRHVFLPSPSFRHSPSPFSSSAISPRRPPRSSSRHVSSPFAAPLATRHIPSSFVTSLQHRHRLFIIRLPPSSSFADRCGEASQLLPSHAIRPPFFVIRRLDRRIHPTVSQLRRWELSSLPAGPPDQVGG